MCMTLMDYCFSRVCAYNSRVHKSFGIIFESNTFCDCGNLYERFGQIPNLLHDKLVNVHLYRDERQSVEIKTSVLNYAIAFLEVMKLPCSRFISTTDLSFVNFISCFFLFHFTFSKNTNNTIFIF